MGMSRSGRSERNFLVLKHGMVIVLGIEEWEYLNFHSHFCILYLPMVSSYSKASFKVVTK